MFWTVTQAILRGCGQAAELFFLTLLFSLPLGLFIAFGTMSKWAPFRRCRRFPRLAAFRPVSALLGVLVWAIRGTPLMLQLIVIFYGPGKWFSVNPWNYLSNGRMFACVVAFVLNYAC